MNRTKPALFGLVCLLALYAAAPWLFPRAVAPLTTTVSIMNEEIFNAVDATARLPMSYVVPIIARTSATSYVENLPLEKSVQDRVLARLKAKGFVHELVPFLLALKNLYVAPEASAPTTFEAHLRANFTPSATLPGFEHELFEWQPASAKTDAESGVGIDGELAAQIIKFYDAVYLRNTDPSEPLSERLSCTSQEIVERLPIVAARAEPHVRTLLEAVRERMGDGAEFAGALDAVMADQHKLETVTLSVVQLVEQLVCKHYRMLSSVATRERDLQSWLHAELKRPGGGKLWHFVDHAQNERKYAALIVVDGLQGHLLEALVDGNPDHPFIQQIALEHQEGLSRLARRSVEEREHLKQQTHFLNHLAQNGISDPAYLPFFKNLYTDSGANDTHQPWAIARGGISTTPTISVRNLPIAKTGAPVAGAHSTGVPNFHFVERSYGDDGRPYYFFGNDALQLTALTEAAGMKTLNQRLPQLSSFSCAAQYDEHSQAGIDALINLGLGEAVRDFGEVLCFAQLHLRADNEVDARKVREELLSLRADLATPLRFFDWYGLIGKRAAHTRAEQLIDRLAKLEAEPLPELLIYYNPWPDHFAHFTGPFADAVIAQSGELARLDYWLGNLTDIYRTGMVEERTLFGMAGDHGLSPVYQLESPQALVFDALIAEGVPIRITKISSDEGEGPKFNHVLQPPPMRGYDAVIASTAGGNLMVDLFIDQAETWRQQPLEADLRRWQPIAWKNQEDARSIDLIQVIQNRLGDTLDYLAVRALSCDATGGQIRIIGPKGSGTITRQGKRIHYAYTGIDLLRLAEPNPYTRWNNEELNEVSKLRSRCLTAPLDDAEGWCTESEWRSVAKISVKPDSVVQLAHLYDLDRAGSINLFPADGVAYNSIVPGRHAGESFHEKDAFVGLWGVPVRRQAHQGRLATAVNGSMPIAIFEYLNGEPITENDPTWGYPSLWSEVYLTKPIQENSK